MLCLLFEILRMSVNQINGYLWAQFYPTEKVTQVHAIEAKYRYVTTNNLLQKLGIYVSVTMVPAKEVLPSFL